MKRSRGKFGKWTWILTGASLTLTTCVVTTVRPVSAWLGDKFERITGNSVEVRARARSKRCAQIIRSAYKSAREEAGGPVPTMDIKSRVRHDQKASRAFFAHRPQLAPASPLPGDSVFYIDVFANSIAKESLLKGAAIFPAGSVIVKRKSLEPDGGRTEYFTGMRKREPGYFSTCGDWEFFVLNARMEEVEAGRLASCAECHQKWPERDFVSRTYFDPNVPGGLKSVIDEKTEPAAMSAASRPD